MITVGHFDMATGVERPDVAMTLADLERMVMETYLAPAARMAKLCVAAAASVAASRTSASSAQAAAGGDGSGKGSKKKGSASAGRQQQTPANQPPSSAAPVYQSPSEFAEGLVADTIADFRRALAGVPPLKSDSRPTTRPIKVCAPLAQFLSDREAQPLLKRLAALTAAADAYRAAAAVHQVHINVISHAAGFALSCVNAAEMHLTAIQLLIAGPLASTSTTAAADGEHASANNNHNVVSDDEAHAKCVASVEKCLGALHDTKVWFSLMAGHAHRSDVPLPVPVAVELVASRFATVLLLVLKMRKAAASSASAGSTDQNIKALYAVALKAASSSGAPVAERVVLLEQLFESVVIVFRTFQAPKKPHHR